MTDQSARPPLLTRPVRAWGSLGRSAQFALYMRWSMQFIVIGLGVLPLLMMLGNELLVNDYLGTLLLLLVVPLPSVGAAVLFLHRAPQLRTGATQFPTRTFQVGVGLTAVTTLGAAFLMLVSEGWREYGLLLLMIAESVLVIYIACIRHRWLIFLGLAAAALLLVKVSDFQYTGTAAIILVVAFPLFVLTTMVTTLWCVGLMKEADQAVELQKTLSVAEERLRFSQELHDTMGQHLAAMSVKAELALALARRGDDRLEGELENLQRLTRVSTTELRDVVDGHRRINLATELAGARRLLESAGTRVTVTGDVFDVPEHHRDIAAWFVREASTNVLKHSDATTAQLTVTATHITMSNDRAHPASTRTGGLNSLRNRAAGGQLTTQRDHDQFTVTLTFGNAASGSNAVEHS